MNLFTNRSSHHGYQRIGGIGINWEIKIDVYTLPYIKQIMRLPPWSSGLRLVTLNAGDMCSIPGWGPKIPHAAHTALKLIN